jgi:outer membrane usher protein
MSYALEGGWLRENFGEENDHYTEPFAQALVARGMNDWLTLEGRLAGTSGVVEIGAGLVAKLAEFAVVNLSLDDSSLSGRDGRQVRASIERQAGPYFLFASAQQSFGDFRDVASAAGDAPIQSGLQAGAGWNSTHLGTFGLNYFQEKTAQDDFRLAHPLFNNIGIVTASWSYPFFREWTAYASAYRSVAGTGSFGFMVGVSLSPAEGLVVDGGVGQSGNRIGAFADASQSPPTDGGWGWSVQTQSAPEPSGQGSVRYVSQIGEVGAGVSASSSDTLGSAYATGSVVWLAGGNPRLARQSGASFAEVDTGQPGVGVTLENREMGKTGSDGRLLVPDLISFTPNHFAIEPGTVPLSEEIVTPSAVVRPPRNAGVIVALPVRVSNSAAVRFVTSDGSAVPFNAPVTLNDQDEGSVGYDGVAWLSGLVADNRVRIGEGDQACTAEFQIAPSDLNTGVQVGPIVCK